MGISGAIPCIYFMTSAKALNNHIVLSFLCDEETEENVNRVYRGTTVFI